MSVCKVRKSYGPHYKVTPLLHWAVKMNRVYMSLYYPVCTHCWKHNGSLTILTSPEVLWGLITWLFKYSSHWGGIVLWNPLWQDSKLKLEIISLKNQRIGVKSNIFKILTFSLTFKIKIQHSKPFDFWKLECFCSLFGVFQFINQTVNSRNSASKKYVCLQLTS